VTCREFVAFLLDYVDDGLPSVERERFDAHLAVCPDCVRYLRDYREVIKSGRLAADEWPADVPDELVAAIVGARKLDG
jgi:anti-sigma factor RsiW